MKIRIGEDAGDFGRRGQRPGQRARPRAAQGLGAYQTHIDDLELRDYRVRVFQGGTDAVTRVLIEFGDGDRRTWSTVGVSGNVIDASFQALVEAIIYRR